MTGFTGPWQYADMNRRCPNCGASPGALCHLDGKPRRAPCIDRFTTRKDRMNTSKPPADTLWVTPGSHMKVSLTPPIDGREMIVALFDDPEAGSVGVALDFTAATALVHAIGDIAGNLDQHRNRARLNNPKWKGNTSE